MGMATSKVLVSRGSFIVGTIFFLLIFSISWTLPDRKFSASLSLEAIYYLFVLAVVIVSAVLLVFSGRLKVELTRTLLCYLVIFGFCAASVAWAKYPLWTIKEVAIGSFVVFSCIFCSKLHRNYDLVGIFWNVGSAMLVLSFVSVMFSIVSGRFTQIMIQRGQIGYFDLQGVFTLDNSFYAAMLFVSFARIDRYGVSLFRVLVLISAAVLLALSFSRSYFLAAMLALMSIYIFRRRLIFVAPCVGICLILVLSLIVTDNFVSRSFKKNGAELTVSSFSTGGSLKDLPIDSSGRFNRWIYAAEQARKSKGGALLGLGWGGSRKVMLESRWDAGYIHGDYARIYVELGRVGLALYVLLLIGLLLYFVKKYRKSTSLDQREVLTVLILLLTYLFFIGVTYETINKYRYFHFVFILYATRSVKLKEQLPCRRRDSV